MDSVIPSSGSLILQLVREEHELFLFLEDPGSRSFLAKFPIKLSLLNAVGDGYSYQVANEYGSLRLALADNFIDVRYEGRNKENLRAKVEKPVFSERLTNFQNDNV